MAVEPIRILGAPGSPYSRKMRALLRYRRIPHVWIQRGAPEDRDLPPVPVDLIPVLVFPRGAGGGPESMVDSTFQIARLEAEYPGRTVRLVDPALDFLDALLEDFADEWVTKMMFHYRWAFAPDVAKAAAILPRWFRIDAPEENHLQFGEMFAQRQTGRLALVGSNPVSAPIIEDSYHRVLRQLADVLEGQRFLFGGRPAASDFALYGQLTQLAQFDPTSAAVALEVAPRIIAWVDLLEDLSGLEPAAADWSGRDRAQARLGELLREVGRTYVPFLLANARAVAAGGDTMHCEIDGRRYEQRPFAYQRKCLGWLRERHAALGANDRAWVDAVLAEAGCAALVAAD